MFYSTDLLNLKGGQFGAVWILGITKSERGSKKELPMPKIYAVNVANTSKDLCKLLPIGANHMSLYLASTLSLGTVKCFCLQVIKLDEDIRNTRESRKKKQRQINNQLMQLYDKDKGQKQVLTNPLTELGKRLEQSDSLSLSQNTEDNTVRGNKGNRNQADPSLITMREDPNIEFGPLAVDEDFGFGTDPNEMQLMSERMQNAIHGDGLFEVGPHTVEDITTVGTVNEDLLMPPPPAPARKSQEDQARIQSTPIDENVEGMDIDSTEISRLRENRLRPFLGDPVPFPDVEESMLLQENLIMGNDFPNGMPIEEGHNEEHNVEEPRETRASQHESGLAVTNIVDENVPSFQLLAPIIIPKDRRRGIRRTKGRGKENANDGPVFQINKEEMNRRRQEGGCKDIIREKEDLWRLGERMRPAKSVDTLLKQPARHYEKFNQFPNVARRVIDFFQSRANDSRKCDNRSDFDELPIPEVVGEGANILEEVEPHQEEIHYDQPIEETREEELREQESRHGTSIDLSRNDKTNLDKSLEKSSTNIQDQNIDLTTKSHLEPVLEQSVEKTPRVLETNVDGIMIQEFLNPEADQEPTSLKEKSSSEEWSEPTWLNPKETNVTQIDPSVLWSIEDVARKLVKIEYGLSRPSHFVLFDELCEPNLWKRNAALAFRHLLSLHKDGAIRLEQEGPESFADNSKLKIYLLEQLFEEFRYSGSEEKSSISESEDGTTHGTQPCSNLDTANEVENTITRGLTPIQEESLFIDKSPVQCQVELEKEAVKTNVTCQVPDIELPDRPQTPVSIGSEEKSSLTESENGTTHGTQPCSNSDTENEADNTNTRDLTPIQEEGSFIDESPIQCQAELEKEAEKTNATCQVPAIELPDHLQIPVTRSRFATMDQSPLPLNLNYPKQVPGVKLSDCSQTTVTKSRFSSKNQSPLQLNLHYPQEVPAVELPDCPPPAKKSRFAAVDKSPLPLNLHNHEQLPNIELPDRPQTPVTRSRFATMVQSPLKLNLPYPKQVPDAELQDCPQTPITKSRLATLEQSALPLNLHNHDQVPDIELPDRPQTPVTCSRFATMDQSPLPLNLHSPKQVPVVELPDCPPTSVKRSRFTTLDQSALQLNLQIPDQVPDIELSDRPQTPVTRSRFATMDQSPLPLNLHYHGQTTNIKLPERPQTPVRRSRFAFMDQSPLPLNLPYPKQVPDVELPDCPQTPVTRSRFALMDQSPLALNFQNPRQVTEAELPDCPQTPVTRSRFATLDQSPLPLNLQYHEPVPDIELPDRPQTPITRARFAVLDQSPVPLNSQPPERLVNPRFSMMDDIVEFRGIIQVLANRNC